MANCSALPVSGLATGSKSGWASWRLPLNADTFPANRPYVPGFSTRFPVGVPVEEGEDQPAAPVGNRHLGQPAAPAGHPAAGNGGDPGEDRHILALAQRRQLGQLTALRVPARIVAKQITDGMQVQASGELFRRRAAHHRGQGLIEHDAGSASRASFHRSVPLPSLRNPPHFRTCLPRASPRATAASRPSQPVSRAWRASRVADDTSALSRGML